MVPSDNHFFLVQLHGAYYASATNQGRECDTTQVKNAWNEIRGVIIFYLVVLQVGIICNVTGFLEMAVLFSCAMTPPSYWSSFYPFEDPRLCSVRILQGVYQCMCLFISFFVERRGCRWIHEPSQLMRSVWHTFKFILRSSKRGVHHQIGKNVMKLAIDDTRLFSINHNFSI